MRKMNKRGGWQDYLLPAIMAVLVLGISFYFIFNEYFNINSLDREVCKESVVARATMPDVKKFGLTLASLKNDFPLKCRTNVVKVTADDIDRGNIDNIIGDAMVECWYIFGGGDSNVFASSIYGKTTTCVPCARIHLTEDAKKIIKDTQGGKIDIKKLLNGAKFDNKFFYLNYLNGVGKLFEPFNPAFSNPFNLSGDKFIVGSFDSHSNLKKVKDGSEIKMNGGFASVSLPRYLKIDEGDLIIVFGEVTDSGKNDVATYIPYMFYYQNGQDDYLDEMKNDFFNNGIDDKICNSWEGIPA